MKNIDKIVAAVDFSEISDRIMKLALLMAEQYQAELNIIFVAETIPTALAGFAMTDVPITQIEEDMYEHSKKRLEKFVEKYRAGYSIPLKCQVLEGQAAKGIIEWSEKNDVDLIIMGTHGYKGLEKMLMGSVAERVLKLAPCPVLTTR